MGLVRGAFFVGGWGVGCGPSNVTFPISRPTSHPQFPLKPFAAGRVMLYLNYLLFRPRFDAFHSYGRIPLFCLLETLYYRPDHIFMKTLV